MAQENQPNSGIANADDIQAVKALNAAYGKMTDQLSRVIVGQKKVIEEVLVAMFCQGHALLVGVPGLPKPCSSARCLRCCT